MTAARRGGTQALPAPAPTPATPNPWRALWAMLVGFFMILVDSTIVAVANPNIMASLETDYDAVIWVTSAYLLAYAVPLLVAGRLGDRFGPKNLYLIGLAVFTLASLACGLAGSVEMLVAARVVQGLGAALLTPQTLSTITRIFPPERRGVAMSLWGATAGVATLVGPLAGGVLVDSLGWQWIFIVNVPIGIIGLALAYWLVPVLPTSKKGFDLVGVALSGIGMFLIVFALQEGQSHDWALWIWAMVFVGVGVMAGFVYWQSITPEPLIPLTLFRDRNFSLSNVGVAVIGFVVTAMVLPAMFYAQAVCGLSPTRSALLTAPMAVASGGLAPFVGKLVDRLHPRPIIGFGFSVVAVALTWLSVEMTPSTPIWRLLLPFTAMGIGMAFIWAPLAATATRNLPPMLAGAGSGVYNATRQVGSVLGSAGMAAFMTSRISAELPGSGDQNADSQVLQLPAFLHEPFSSAMSQSLLLPAFIALFGVVAAVFLASGRAANRVAAAVVSAPGARPAVRTPDDYPTDVIDAVVDPHSAYKRPTSPRDPDADYSDEFDDYDDYEEGDYSDDFEPDDDDYVEYTVPPAEPPAPAARVEPAGPPPDDSITEPIPLPVASAVAPHFEESEEVIDAQEWTPDGWQPEPVASQNDASDDWRVPASDSVDEWDSFLDNLKDDLRSMADEPIGHAHNGFHIDRDDHPLTPLATPDPLSYLDAGTVNGASNGHVNGSGSHERHGSDFLDGLGFARGNGFFANLDEGATAPEPSSRHHRSDGWGDSQDPEPRPRHGADDFTSYSGGAHREEPESPSGTWRFVDGTWKYETETAQGRHSSDPDDSGYGRHSHPRD